MLLRPRRDAPPLPDEDLPPFPLPAACTLSSDPGDGSTAALRDSSASATACRRALSLPFLRSRRAVGPAEAWVREEGDFPRAPLLALREREEPSKAGAGAPYCPSSWSWSWFWSWSWLAAPSSTSSAQSPRACANLRRFLGLLELSRLFVADKEYSSSGGPAPGAPTETNGPLASLGPATAACALAEAALGLFSADALAIQPPD